METLGANRRMGEHLSLTGELQYVVSSVWVSATEYVDLRNIRLPISTRFQLWELYGVVPQGSLGLVVGQQQRSSFNLSGAIQQNDEVLKSTTATSTGLSLNLGGAIPHRYGYLQVDFHHYSSFTSVTVQKDIRVREHGLVLGYTY